MARKTKEEAERTRQLLIDTAEQLFWDKGVSKSSLADIAKAAGVTRGAIYWHFANKADLFNAMCERINAEFQELVSLEEDDTFSPAQRLWVHSCTVLRLISGSPQLLRIITILNMRCEYVGEMEGVFKYDRTWLSDKIRTLEVTLRQAAEVGQIRDGIDLGCASLSLHATITGLIDEWLTDPDTVNLSVLAEKLLTPYFAGVFRDDCWLLTTDERAK